MTKKHNPYTPSASGTPEPPEVQPVDDFDLADIRVQSSTVGIKRATIATLRRPGRTEWVRVHPGFELPILAVKEDGVWWVLTHEMAMTQEEHVRPHVIYLACARHTGEVFLWLVPVPSGDRPNAWHVSHATAAVTARVEWVNMASSSALRRYDVRSASYHDEPVWPEEAPESIAKRVLGPLLIRSTDHPALRRLRGEV